MPQFIETVRVKNGIICNLDFHNKRLNDTCKAFFGKESSYDLSKMITLPNYYQEGTVKMRVVYNSEKFFAQFSPYSKKIINSLLCVHDDEISYQFKFLNRDSINHLLDDIDQDDVLIIKNNLVTDTSYCNVAFRANDQWFTPKKPLLNGTQRQLLLKEDKLIPRDISLDEISKFNEIALFNAMIPFEQKITISIKNISQ